MNDLKKEVALIKKDDLRTQLMVMIRDFPNEKTDILRLGQHYFEDLHGNWVLTNIFTEWLMENDIVIPNWLQKRGLSLYHMIGIFWMLYVIMCLF